MTQYAHLSNPSQEWLEYTKNGDPPVLNGSLSELRASLGKMKTMMNKKTPMPSEELEVKEIEIPSKGKHTIPIRWYRPYGKTRLPVVIIYHGGGFALGDLENEEVSSRYIANYCTVLVFNVDYRLAPEHPFPAGLEDSYDAVKWVARHSTTLGGDPTRGFIVGGFSAGSTFAAVCVQLARDENLHPPITGQLLSSPATIHPSVYPEEWRAELLSMEQNANAPIINAKSTAIFEGYYAVPDYRDPRASPALHPNLKDLPRAYFQITGMDPLRDEGFLYDWLLRENGTATKLDVYPGLPHTFWTLPGVALTKQWTQDTINGVQWLLS